jgi:circadian clock protein KaiC
MRTPSYITELDNILQGGFIKPSAILVAGSCGTGKTSLCMQSIFNAAKNGERCAYVSILSESVDKITRSLSSFSFYDEQLVKEKIKILSINSDVMAKGDFAIFEYLNENILKDNPSRVVIDTINILEDIESTFDERPLHKCELRAFVQDLFREFDDKGILLIATGEIPASSVDSSLWPYMCDTVITLDMETNADDPHRYLEILKERGSSYIMGKHGFHINSKGIVLDP